MWFQLYFDPWTRKCCLHFINMIILKLYAMHLYYHEQSLIIFYILIPIFIDITDLGCQKHITVCGLSEVTNEACVLFSWLDENRPLVVSSANRRSLCSFDWTSIRFSWRAQPITGRCATTLSESLRNNDFLVLCFHVEHNFYILEETPGT